MQFVHYFATLGEGIQKMRHMAVDTINTQSSLTCKPMIPSRRTPSQEHMSQHLIHNMTEINNEKPTLTYDILCRDDAVGPLALTDEQKKDKYLVVIATTLAQLTARGDKQKCSHKCFRSSSGRLPPISLEAYIARLLQYAPCDRECFLTALIYMDRLAEKCGFVFTSMNVHRSYLVSLMVAAKFFEDQPCDNGYFATVGGVSIQEINVMEITFLSLLEYRVAVSGVEYNLYAQVVEAKADYLDKPRQHYLKEAIAPDTSAACLGLVIKPIPASS